jgi:hypothetical protein
MRNRYVIAGPWSVNTTSTFDHDDATSTLTVETTDLRDTRSGTVYREGAYRVQVVSTVSGAPRTKVFKGETAWSQAERYAEDARLFFRRVGW